MLKAFSDDIVSAVKNENELKNVINEFELLKGDLIFTSIRRNHSS